MERKILIISDDYNALYIDYEYLPDFFTNLFFEGAIDFFVLINNSYSILIYKELKALKQKFKPINVVKVTTPTLFLENFKQKQVFQDDDKTFICPVKEDNFENITIDCALYALDYVDKVCIISKSPDKYSKIIDKANKFNKKILFTTI